MGKRNFEVHMYESEYRQIQAWVDKYQHVETGGDLFGLWADEHTAVVQLVLGPGKNCRRTGVSFYQDVDYLERVGNILTTEKGLCHIGEWHSHHRLGLSWPSGGDENTVWTNMDRYGVQRFFLFIATIGSRSSEVNIGCFLFEINPYNNRREPVLQGEIRLFSGNEESPFRKSVQQHLAEGAESQNSTQSLKKFKPNLGQTTGKRWQQNDNYEQDHKKPRLQETDNDDDQEMEESNEVTCQKSNTSPDMKKKERSKFSQEVENQEKDLPTTKDTNDNTDQQPKLTEDNKKPVIVAKVIHIKSASGEESKTNQQQPPDAFDRTKSIITEHASNKCGQNEFKDAQQNDIKKSSLIYSEVEETELEDETTIQHDKELDADEKSLTNKCGCWFRRIGKKTTAEEKEAKKKEKKEKEMKEKEEEKKKAKEKKEKKKKEKEEKKKTAIEKEEKKKKEKEENNKERKEKKRVKLKRGKKKGKKEIEAQKAN